MFKIIILLVILAINGVFFVLGTENPKTVCYYESWVHWRKGQGHMEPEDIDTTLCTHIVYSYFGIDASTHKIILLDPYLMVNLHDLEKFVQHKKNAKAFIAIGGTAMSDRFSQVSAVTEYRETFVDSTIELLKRYGFDGVIIDWYNMNPNDKDNYQKLLESFHYKMSTTLYKLAVTIPAQIESLSNYDIEKTINLVEFINVLSLDYAGPWNTIVGHSSPLPEQLKTLEMFNKLKASKNKLIMAVPFYARTWTLVSPSKQEVGARASGPGTAGPYTKTPGFLSYNELCVKIEADINSFTLVRDNENTALYAVYLHNGIAEWISFEDKHTLAKKAYKITELGYGGMTTYTLSNEDVHGICGQPNPLLKAINENYNHDVVTEQTVKPMPTTTTRPTDIPDVFKCRSEGFFRDKTYCQKYYECKKGDFGLELTIHYCKDERLAFDEKTNQCIDRDQIPGC